MSDEVVKPEHETQPAIHTEFKLQMTARVSELKDVRKPNFNKIDEDLWHIVQILRCVPFCKQVWFVNIREGRVLDRWEMEACWFQFVLTAYRAWDPLTKSKRKSFEDGRDLKKKLLQNSMLQMFALADAFWEEKKKQYPQIDTRNAVSWPEYETYDDGDEKYGLFNDHGNYPVYAFSEIGEDEIDDRKDDQKGKRNAEGDVVSNADTEMWDVESERNYVHEDGRDDVDRELDMKGLEISPGARRGRGSEISSGPPTVRKLQPGWREKQEKEWEAKYGSSP